MRMCLVVGQPPAMQRRLVHRGDQELVVGAEGDAEMRARPFQKFRRSPPCWETTASRRCNARSPAAGPSARTRARRRSRAHRTIFPRPCRCGRRRSCRPTTPPRRRDAARHCRSSAASASVASSVDLALGVERNELAVIAAHHDALAVGRRAQDAAAVDGDAARSRLAPLTSATFSSAPTKAALSPRKCTDVTGAPIATGRTRSVTETMEAGFAAGSNCCHHVVMQRSKPSRIVCSGNSRPMKTRRLSRGSPSFQSRW